MSGLNVASPGGSLPHVASVGFRLEQQHLSSCKTRSWLPGCRQPHCHRRPRHGLTLVCGPTTRRTRSQGGQNLTCTSDWLGPWL